MRGPRRARVCMTFRRCRRCGREGWMRLAERTCRQCAANGLPVVPRRPWLLRWTEVVVRPR